MRKITENSSNGSGFGSISNNPPVADSSGGAGLVFNGIPTANLMGSSGVHYNTGYGPDNSSQTSLGGAGSMGPLRYHHLQTPGARMGRRVSDGGPYVAAYKLFIEKRNPQLTQIMSANHIEKTEGTNMSSANSVKMLLQDKIAHGGLPHKDWFHYKEQVCISVFTREIVIEIEAPGF